VVLEHMHDIDRAHDYANKVDEPAVWSELGHAQLEANLVPDAIASYLRSSDTSMYLQVRAGPRLLCLMSTTCCACTSWSVGGGVEAKCIHCHWLHSPDSAAVCATRLAACSHARPASGTDHLLLYPWRAGDREGQDCGLLRRPGQVPAHGAQEGEGGQGGHGAVLRIRQGEGWGGHDSQVQLLVAIGWRRSQLFACCWGLRHVWVALLRGRHHTALRGYGPGAVQPCQSLPSPAAHSTPSLLRISPSPAAPLQPRCHHTSPLTASSPQVNNLSALEEFIANPHQANLQNVGDRCFDEALYEAARIIFAHMPNYGRLASTLVKLHRFQEAVDAARKANSPKTWKEVCYACVDEKEFKLAQLCGLNIIINAEDMEEVRGGSAAGGQCALPTDSAGAGLAYCAGCAGYGSTTAACRTRGAALFASLRAQLMPPMHALTSPCRSPAVRTGQ
jgi:hypothetical protein